MSIERKKIKCPNCGEDFLQDRISDYDTFVRDGSHEVIITIKNLERKMCPHCQEEFLGSEALDRIQKEKPKKY